MGRGHGRGRTQGGSAVEPSRPAGTGHRGATHRRASGAPLGGNDHPSSGRFRRASGSRRLEAVAALALRGGASSGDDGPQSGAGVSRRVGRTDAQLHHEIPDNSFSTVGQRVARHLFDLALEVSPPLPSAEIVVASSQRELADAVGTAREVVVRGASSVAGKVPCGPSATGSSSSTRRGSFRAGSGTEVPDAPGGAAQTGPHGDNQNGAGHARPPVDDGGGQGFASPPSTGCSESEKWPPCPAIVDLDGGTARIEHRVIRLTGARLRRKSTNTVKTNERTSSARPRRRSSTRPDSRLA